MTTFIQKLEAQWAGGKYLCVGLDPVFEKLPEDPQGYARTSSSIEDVTVYMGESMLRIIDASHEIAAAYKPNTAFYERYGVPGFIELERVVKHARATGVPLILDSKRGDIGATNEHYAAMAFDTLKADAITIHPYLGWQANQPFLDRADKGIFVLCRTSNAGAGEFQDYDVVLYPDTGTPLNLVSTEEKVTRAKNDNVIVSKLFRRVAEHVSDPGTWNQNGNCGLVAGATYPGEIAEIRRIAPDIPLLIPGIGKQGGDLEATMRAARHRFLINSSSGIIFAENPQIEAETLHYQIQEMLANLG